MTIEKNNVQSLNKETSFCIFALDNERELITFIHSNDSKT